MKALALFSVFDGQSLELRPLGRWFKQLIGGSGDAVL
jgi:hypothetical protein